MSPSSHKRTNTSRTAREYASSSVKRVRLQSHEQPITVMLGGGMTITYGSRGDSTRAVNTPQSSQRCYSGRSTSCGSYWGGSSQRGGGIPYNRQIIDRLVEVVEVVEVGGGWW